MNIEEAIHIINSSNSSNTQRVRAIKFDYVTMYVVETISQYNRWTAPPGVYCNDISIMEMAKKLRKDEE